MKKLVKLTALLIVSVMAMTLIACSSYGSLEKAFKDAGYVVSEDVEATVEAFKQEAEKEEIVLTPHVLVKSDLISSDMVFILEFKTTDDLREFYDESDELKMFIKDVMEDEDSKAFYDKLVEKGYARGNCLIISTNPINRSEVVKIVKGE